MSEKRRIVSAEKFVMAIVTHDTIEDAANALGMNVDSAHQRYMKYRREGVKLPNRSKTGNTRGGKVLDLAALNALIGGAGDLNDEPAVETEQEATS